MAKGPQPEDRQQQIRRGGNERDVPVRAPQGCAGYCHVQTYEVRFSGETVVERADGCPGLTPEQIATFGKRLLPDKTLQRCQDGEDCVCTPREVPADDPSWSKWRDTPLREPKTFRALRPGDGLDEPIGFCDYTISGSVQIRSRIDNDAVCLPGAI